MVTEQEAESPARADGEMDGAGEAVCLLDLKQRENKTLYR